MNYEKRVVKVVHLDRIRENVRNIMAELPPSVKTCAVIKADAYGHGAPAVAASLKDSVDFYAVATAREAFTLRREGILKPILILGYVWPADYADMIRQEIRFAIFKEQDAAALSELAVTLGKKAIIHIKLDTGMNRIGFQMTEEAVETVRRIRQMPGLITEGIFTHFARADEADKDYTYEQFSAYCHFVAEVEKGCGRIPIHHCSNSAASMELPDMALDMVRLGIAMYGIYPSDEVSRRISLQPALELKSEIVYLKDVPMGEGISYNHIKLLTRDSVVATIPVGYGDGYPRLLSNKGAVLIHGKRARILGRICMDQLMVDVTEIPEAAEGDTVTLIGKDGDNEITAEEISELSGIFPYELLCQLGSRVARFYADESFSCHEAPDVLE